jgi:hypothetical protein
MIADLGLVADDFTPDSWQQLQDALAAARRAFGPPRGTDAEVAAALAGLREALRGLTRNPTNGDHTGSPTGDPDLDALLAQLTSLLNALSQLNRSDYTDGEWADILKLMRDAAALMNNPSATPAQLKSMIESLTTAYTTAVKKVTANVTSNTTVTPPSVAVFKVKLNQKKLNLVKGKTAKLYGIAYDRTGTKSKSKVRWTSSKKKVVAVSQAGKVRGKKVGKATVTAKAPNGKTAKIVIKVIKKKPKKSKARIKSVRATGFAEELKVGQVTYAYGKYSPATAVSAKIRYSSSKPAVATITAAGRIKAWKPGKTKIRVRAGTKSKRYTITVTKA